MQSNIHAQPQQGNETAGSGGHVGNQSQVGNQAQSGQPYPGQSSSPPVVQIPQTTGAVPFPSLNVVWKYLFVHVYLLYAFIIY